MYSNRMFILCGSNFSAVDSHYKLSAAVLSGNPLAPRQAKRGRNTLNMVKILIIKKRTKAFFAVIVLLVTLLVAYAAYAVFNAWNAPRTTVYKGTFIFMDDGGAYKFGDLYKAS